MPALSACAPLQALSPARTACRTVRPMGDTGEACAGRGDGTDCPNGENDTEVLVDGVRCEECQHHYEVTRPGAARPAVEDDGLTRPMGDPDEAGHRGDAA